MTTSVKNKSDNGVITLEEQYKSRSLWMDAWLRLSRNKAAMLGITIIVIAIILALFADVIAPRNYDDNELEQSNSAPQWLVDIIPILAASNETIEIAGTAELNVKSGDEVSAGTLIGSVGEEITEYASSADGVVTFKRGKNLEIVVLDLAEGTPVPDSYDSELVLETIKVQRSTELSVEEGDYVTAGDIVGSVIGQEAEEYINRIKGTVFVDGNEVTITQSPVEHYSIEDGWETLVVDGQSVSVGDILLQETNGSGTVTAKLPTVVSDERCAANPETGVRPALCVGTIYIVDDTVIVRNPSFGFVTVNNDYILGADNLGRDVLSRIIYGAQVSLIVAFVGPMVSLAVGLTFGLISGYAGGRVDNMMMRFVDIMYAFPTILLIILMMAFFRTVFAVGTQAVSLDAPVDESATTLSIEAGLESEFRNGWTITIGEEDMKIVEVGVETLEVERGTNGTVAAAHDTGARFTIHRPVTFAYRLNQLDEAAGGMLFIIIGVGLTSWMGMARLTRGQVLSVREKEYVEAAQSLGASTPTIMFRHVMPNILGPIIVAETLTIPAYISFEAFLSFIGLGVNPPTPSWGHMISEGAQTLRTYPHQAIFPALALFLIMFAFNFLGDGLRDALDPRMRGVD